MATPTKAELFNQLAHACRLIDEFNKYCTSNTRNFLTDSDSFQQSFEGNHVAATQAALDTFRGSLDSLIKSGAEFIEPILVDIARIGYNSVEETINAMLDDIYDGMVESTETILNRGWTFENKTTGLGSAGPNTGTGSCYRLVVDADGYDIESGSPVGGTVKLLCVRDQHHGLSPGREEFAVYGDGQPPWDNLDLGTAPGFKGLIYATRAADGLLSNASFDSYAGTKGATFTSEDDLPGWTFGSDYFNFSIDATAYYRREPGQNTGNALNIADNDYIYQYFYETNIQIDPTLPVFLIVRYNREEGACDGTLTITLGTETNSIVLSAQTDWNDLCIGVADSTSGWYKNFKDNTGGNGVIVKVELSGRTTGYLLVDEIILAQPALYDGRWYLVTAGPLDYLKDDSFTYADTVTNSGTMQYWISRLFGKYLPHATATPTYSDTPT